MNLKLLKSKMPKVLQILSMCKFLRLFFAILVISCSSDSKLEAEIAKVAVDVRIDRFDVKFSNANPGELPQLKKTISVFVSPAIF
jgi:hypothetical protein